MARGSFSRGGAGRGAFVFASRRYGVMRVLVACEFSGKVRDAFIARGHDAWSCDTAATHVPGPHILGDVREVMYDHWDMMIAFPPCTYLSAAGAKYWKGREPLQEAALDFVRELMAAPIDRIAIENPVGVISTAIRPPDQMIHPWQFGHSEKKKTCIWLKNLPPLHPTQVVEEGVSRLGLMGESLQRRMIRSITYDGIADAMAEQWGAQGSIPTYVPMQRPT